MCLCVTKRFFRICRTVHSLFHLNCSKTAAQPPNSHEYDCFVLLRWFYSFFALLLLYLPLVHYICRCRGRLCRHGCCSCCISLFTTFICSAHIVSIEQCQWMFTHISWREKFHKCCYCIIVIVMCLYVYAVRLCVSAYSIRNDWQYVFGEQVSSIILILDYKNYASVLDRHSKKVCTVDQNNEFYSDALTKRNTM